MLYELHSRRLVCHFIKYDKGSATVSFETVMLELPLSHCGASYNNCFSMCCIPDSMTALFLTPSTGICRPVKLTTRFHQAMTVGDKSTQSRPMLPSFTPRLGSTDS